jgi:hypothetical protein
MPGPNIYERIGPIGTLDLVERVGTHSLSSIEFPNDEMWHKHESICPMMEAEATALLVEAYRHLIPASYGSCWVTKTPTM